MKLAPVLLLVVASCSDRKTPEPASNVEPPRVMAPPSRVRAFPPYDIRTDGVGPYKLGASASTLLEQLPSGPRINQFALPGVIRADLIHAEDDAVVIGVEPQRSATFIGVLGRDIARTETGIHVGSTRADVERRLGPPLDDVNRAQDPRLVVPAGLKNVRILVEEDQVSAFVVLSEPERAGAPATDTRCVRPAGDRKQRTFGVCFPKGPVVARYEGDSVSLILASDEQPATMKIPGLVYATALRNPRDGTDDLVAIAKSEDGQSKSWSLIAFRLQGSKLVPTIPQTNVYSVEETDARWIGADLRSVELYLELTGRADSIDVGGVFTSQTGDHIGDVVVLLPKSIDRRRERGVPQEARDAGPEAGDATDASAGVTQ